MQIEKDIIIFGGGVAGLWLLNRLRSAGYAAILLEAGALGQGQSIASQGMIHGGMKYALGGTLTGAAQSIADMPAHWRRCLHGEGDVDLRGTRVLSEAYYMWPRNSVRSRLTAFLGSKAVHGKVAAVAQEDLPAFFKGHVKGPLYRLQDLVLDVPSLLSTLAERCRGHIYSYDPAATRISHDAKGHIQHVSLPGGQQVSARLYICTAGEGNQQLLGTLASSGIAMQKRPLQMVVVKHDISRPLYVHCVADQLSATPELTVTTHHCRDGRHAWYLGGELAEAGAGIDQAEQIVRSKAKLAELFPWCNFSAAQWHSFYINRAEAAQPGGKRPDQASVFSAANVMFCWPTKLTLAPNLANTVLQNIQQRGLLPQNTDDTPVQHLAAPAVAAPPWEVM